MGDNLRESRSASVAYVVVVDILFSLQSIAHGNSGLCIRGPSWNNFFLIFFSDH